MQNGDEKKCKIVRTYLETKNYEYSEKEEEHSTKFIITSNNQKGNLKVFNSGSIVVQGKDSPLKKELKSLEESIKNGSVFPDWLKSCDTIQENYSDRASKTVQFMKEAVNCYINGNSLATIHMLALASESVIYEYAKSKDRFLACIYGLKIPGYQNLKKAYELTDQEKVLDGIIHYYRIARNEYGHPQITKNLEPDDITQFIKKTEELFQMI